MTKYRIYFTGDEDEPCEADGLLDAVSDECEREGDFILEAEDGEAWHLCAEHKDAAKAAGIAS